MSASAPDGAEARGRTLYDVFGRAKPGAPITHLGSLEAPDAELASLYASQLFARRGEQQDLYVEARTRQHAAPCYERVLEHHALRDAASHSAPRRMARSKGRQES